MKTIYNIIDAYITGNLSVEEEQYLFTTLAADAEAREYFKERQIVAYALKAADTPFPAELDEAILSRVQESAAKAFPLPRVNPIAVTVFSAVAVLCITVLFFFNRIELYRSEVDRAMLEVSNQKQTIELLINGLPTVQVTSQTNKPNLINN